MAISRKARNVALPVAMLVGALLHDFFGVLGFLPPYLIFLMLYVTFTRIPVRQLKVTGMHWTLLAIQLLGGAAVYFLVLPLLGQTIAQGMMVCVFTSVAMAATVIAGILGAHIATMATFTLISNLGLVIAAPIFFSAIAPGSGISFWESALMVFSRVGPMLLLPFIISVLTERFLPKFHRQVQKMQDLSFWLWIISLTIVMGRTVNFIMVQPASTYHEIWILAGGALVVCLLQFALGRWIGRKYGDKAAGGQSLGQKNTVLAIWMAQTYLNPLSSIAPAMYVVWQNIVNSWQLWRYKK